MTAALIAILLLLAGWLTTLFHLAAVSDQAAALREERDEAWKAATDSRAALLALMARKERQRDEHAQTLAKVLKLHEGRRS